LPGVSLRTLEKDPYKPHETGSYGDKLQIKQVGAFMNDASLIRLAVSILVDVNEEMITGNRYFICEE